jgi:hypothetical protein
MKSTKVSKIKNQTFSQSFFTLRLSIPASIFSIPLSVRKRMGKYLYLGLSLLHIFPDTIPFKSFNVVASHTMSMQHSFFFINRCKINKLFLIEKCSLLGGKTHIIQRFVFLFFYDVAKMNCCFC